MPGFRIRSRQEDAPTTPEAVFRSLRPHDPSVRDLWLRQGDLLRAYSDLANDVADVALELPTGAGKTLVGLLVAEYRRRALDHRVAYLCPNVQLARQAAAKADSYGIDAVTLVRRQANWDPAEFFRYSRGDAIAIATYFQVFNSNPRLDSAQTLILDDAHAGEEPVAGLWSVTALRGDDLYETLLATVVDDLPALFAERVRDEGLRPELRSDVELVPPLAIASKADSLTTALGQHATDHNRYASEMITRSIGHCLVYVSWSEILIRPLIAPTNEHVAFAGADQRVYMSATLGADGELERAFGVPEVRRLRPRSRDEDHDTGRRFFILPNATHDQPEADTIISQALERAGRSLVLAPSYRELDRFKAACLPEGLEAVTAEEVEDSFDAFVAKQAAALLLANRYDGMDLPDEACRLIVLTGMPARTHLQERFFLDRLGARRVLSERIRTRLVQGAGRCTRNSRDFAAVIIRGEGLTDFSSREEEIRAMRPELQAEMRFGLDNSEQTDVDLNSLLEDFLQQGAAWQVAETHLRAETAHAQRADVSDAESLRAAASHEVECWRALWRDDLRRAVNEAQSATDQLSGGPGLRPYRALWFYFAASWSRELEQTTHRSDDRELANTLQSEAEGAARTMRWFPQLGADPPAAQPEEWNARADRAARKLLRLGIRGSKFERHVSEALVRIRDDEATRFELGLLALGELLGFDAIRPNDTSDPDGVWGDDERLRLLFEAKTEEGAGSPVSTSAVRQAQTHPQWVESRLDWPPPERQVTLLVSNRTQIHPDASAIAGGVLLVTPDAIRAVAGRAVDVHREVRAQARGRSEQQLVADFAHRFAHRQLDNGGLVHQLSPRPITDG